MLMGNVEEESSVHNHQMPSHNHKFPTLHPRVEASILKHLVSPNSFEPLTFLEEQESFDYTLLGLTRKQVQNRFQYHLRNLQESSYNRFIDLCLLQKVAFNVNQTSQENLGNKKRNSEGTSSSRRSTSSGSTTSSEDTEAEEEEDYKEEEGNNRCREGAQEEAKEDNKKVQQQSQFIATKSRGTPARSKAPPKIEVLMSTFTKLSLIGAPRGTKRYSVNPEDPEEHENIRIFPSYDIPGTDGKSYYNGFNIIVMVDIRWIKYYNVKMLQARLLSRNSILLKYPKSAFSFIHPADYESFNRGLDADTQFALDEHRHSTVEKIEGNNMQPEFRYILLDFDDAEYSGIELSSKVIFNGAGENEKLKLKLKNESGDFCWAIWKVARTDIAPVRKGKLVLDTTPKKTEAQELLEELESGMA
jgi:hypothetical protein